MESKEYVTYSRRAKAVERPSQQSSLFKNDIQFQGYRSTKQWVQEVSQQSRGTSLGKAEQQQQYQSEGPPKGLNVSPCPARTRKKDGRGVHFKQENDQTASRLECKANQASLLSPAIVRKDGCFSDGQAAALSPISLNVAVGGRQVTTSPVPAKHFPADASLPKGVAQTQGQKSLTSSDGRGQTLPSLRDEDGRQVVWCNAAFEADDDLKSCKSQDSARSNRYSPASCSKNAESDISGSAYQRQDHQHAWTPGMPNVCANPNGIFSQEFFSYSPAISGTIAIAGSSPATLMEKCPEQNSRLPNIAQSELEPAAGEWYTPMGSEAGESSNNSRNYAQGNEKPIDLSQTRRTLAASPSFKKKTPPTLPHANRHVPGARARSSSCTKSRNYPKYCTEVTSNCESDRRRSSNPRACLSYDYGPRSARKTGGLPVLAGKMDPPRIFIPKIQRFQGDPMVEEDLEADIEHEIEQEISMEILQLSERLAALHAKQETRKVAGSVGQDRPKSGGISCPQSPTRNATSPSGSDTAKRPKGRVVAAKFLQYSTNDGNHVKRDKSVNRTEKPAAKLFGFTDGPFIGRPNPPRRSLGTPSRLLTKGKPNGRQRSSSPNNMVKERTMGSRPADSEEQSGGIGANAVPYEEYVRSRAMLESGGSGKRVARVLSQKNLGEEDRKEWSDRGYGQQVKKENQPGPTLCTASTTMQQPHFYPEFERKVDWVKSLRTDPIPAAHLSGTMNSHASALDERFLKQKSERQDVRAWLRENIGVAEGNCDTPNFPAHSSGAGIYDGGLQRGVQADVGKTMTAEEEDSTISTRPSNAWASSLSNARSATPSRCTPYRATTPSRGNARTVPSRYGTPVKTVPARDQQGNKCFDSKPIFESPGAGSKTWYSRTTPSKRYSSDTKVALPIRKASPTIRKGYPVQGAVKNETSFGTGVGALKDERGLVYSNHQGHRKITVVEAEYEKFVQESAPVDQQGPAVSRNTVVDGGSRGQGANQEIRLTTPSAMRYRAMPDLPGSASAPKPAKKIFIRCSDLIKDKHFMLVKGKQRLAGQSVLPSEGLDSDDSVFARSNTRTDLSELDGYNSRSEEASIIEESTYIKDCQHSHRRGDERTGMTSGKSSESATPDYDIVYNFESGSARGSSYRPEDYTLEMMLQYVDTLKCERESLPRIRAIKDGGTGGGSARDSGCIKRRKEGEKRARLYFNADGEPNKVQVPNCATMDLDGLSPNEIEGLDLESFWCLVGEPQPNLI
ncbi:unnamed protein product [Calypogeia fissa]